MLVDLYRYWKAKKILRKIFLAIEHKQSFNEIEAVELLEELMYYKKKLEHNDKLCKNITLKFKVIKFGKVFRFKTVEMSKNKIAKYRKFLGLKSKLSKNFKQGF